MRTARALTVSPSMLCGGGVVYLVQEAVPGPGEVYLVRGVYLVLGGVPGQVLPPCGQTHTCKLITLPQTSFAGGNKNAFQYDAYCPLVNHIP